MDFGVFINMALPIVYVIVGLALVWFLIELVMTVRKARSTVDEVQKKIEPTLTSLEKITASLEPAVAKVDPLVERVSLTVDAANLEIMRLDQILEDVSEITDTVSSAANAVETAANAPISLVNSMTDRVRSVFKSHRASDESVALGASKTGTLGADGKNPAAALVEEGMDVAEQYIIDRIAREEIRKAAHEAQKAEKKEAAAAQNKAAARVAQVAQANAAADAGVGPEAYFTYDGSASGKEIDPEKAPSASASENGKAQE